MTGEFPSPPCVLLIVKQVLTFSYRWPAGDVQYPLQYLHMRSLRAILHAIEVARLDYDMGGPSEPCRGATAKPQVTHRFTSIDLLGV